MQIHGLNKTTLLDYPGIVASTVFTGTCNFRCPFCQNSDLVLNPASQPLISEEEIFAHLAKRKGVVKGVCITGGEPTVQKDLKDFIIKLKDMGLMVKLDTNGYKPQVLRDLIESNLLDYIAMDIKSSFAGYRQAAGIDIDNDIIRDSIDIIMNSEVDYEFRTTVVKELHDTKTFKDIAFMLSGAKRYFLQGYVDSDRVLMQGLSSYSKMEMEKFTDLLRQDIDLVEIRGLD